ncbi:MAG: glycosyltransferase family 4 protein [Phycisphaerales bacterium]|nr:glycosyltransferase family 4 protein [Phycisphaerales bacterium]
MNPIIFIAEYVRSMPWSTTAWVPALARALAAHGHRVHVLCDGVEDPALFDASPRLSLHIRRPRRKLRASDPLAFADWARRCASQVGPAHTVSFTHNTPGDLWIPLGEKVLPTLGRAIRAHRPATAAMEVLHRPWAVKALRAERQAAALARASGSRCARLGAPAAGDPPDASTAFLGLASQFPALADDARRAARARLRSLLEVPHDSLVLMSSAVHADRDGLDSMLAGVRQYLRSTDGHILLLGRKTHTLATLARRHDLVREAHILGATRDIPAVLAAADLALLPASRPDPRSTGRFLADCLHAGLPLIASPLVAGSSILRPAGSPAAGLVLDSHAPAAWREALSTAASPAWRAIAAAQAASVGCGLTIDSVAARLVDLLLDPR